MKILVACEESQAVTIQMRKLGHEAYSCDIQECSGGHPEWHVQGDAIEALVRDGGGVTTMDKMYHPISKWDLVIAHPPCTYLSNAGACRLYPKKGQLDKDRFINGLNGKQFFMWFWIYGRLGIGPIAIQNPIPSSIYELPKPTQAIQPWQFGHPFTKKTYLWLFGLPQLQPTDVVEPKGPFVPSGTGRKLGGASYGDKSCAHDGKARSKTFQGIAKAMAEQWAGKASI